MPRLLITTAFASLIFIAPSLLGAAPLMKFSTITASVELAKVINQAAALRYSNIADDLKSAILAVLVDRVSDDGSHLVIDLSEVELSNSFSEAVGSADTRMVGLVSVEDPLNNSRSKSFTLTIDINQALSFLPANVDMTQLKASSDEYYHAVIQAFAKNAIEEIDK